MSGNLELVKWLYQGFELNILKNKYNYPEGPYYSAFRYACIEGHIPVAEWLLTEYTKIDEHYELDNNFQKILSKILISVKETGKKDMELWMNEKFRNIM